jgi:hypothetical protein
MWFYLKSRKPFAFPGLWDCWLDRDTGSQLYTFTIITTRANGLVRRIHDRMPVIYDATMGRQWLDGPFGMRRMALDLVLQPLPSERMEAHEVSTLVNSPENDTPACIQAVSAVSKVKRSCRYFSTFVSLWLDIAHSENTPQTIGMVLPIGKSCKHPANVADCFLDVKLAFTTATPAPQPMSVSSSAGHSTVPPVTRPERECPSKKKILYLPPKMTTILPKPAWSL